MVFKMKKAQMEAFGLAIVVILIVMGIYFMTIFYKPASYSDERITYMDEVIAQRIVFDMFKLNTTCGWRMDDLVIDCYLSKTQGYEQWICDGVRSCDYIDEVVDNILKNTLEPKNKYYNFSIQGTGISKSFGICEGERTTELKPFADIGISFYASLSICRN